MKKRFIFAENLHNMKPNTVILVGILFMLSLSCQKNDKQLITQPLEQNEGLRQIPVEEALATLNEFLQANKGDLLETNREDLGKSFRCPHTMGVIKEPKRKHGP